MAMVSKMLVYYVHGLWIVKNVFAKFSAFR